MLGLLFPFSESAKLKELLRLENPNLEDLLDQDCILSELKNSNRRLINYLCRPQVFDALIAYITQPPKKLSTHEPTESAIDFKPNKFPFVVCDLLSHSNETISQHFLGLAGDPINEKENRLQPSFWRQLQMGIFGSPGNQSPESKDIEMEIEQTSESRVKTVPPIAKFLEFLDQSPPLNPTQAGYFAKVLRNFVYFKPERTCKLLFGQYYRYLEKLNTHIYSDSLQELLSIIIKLEAPYFANNQKEYYVMQRRELVSNVMMNLFEKRNNQDVHDLQFSKLTNSSNLLAGLLSNSATFTNREAVTAPLFHENFLKKCMRGLSNANMINVMSPIIKQLCEYHTIKYAISKDPIILTFPFGQDCITESRVPDSEAFISEVVKSIQGIADIVKIENKDFNPEETEFQYRKTQHSFGPHRIKLIELIYSFLKLQNESIYNEIKRTGLLSILLPLFTKNPWNNILHMALLRIFTFIIARGSENLKLALLKETDILEFFSRAADDSGFEINSKTKGKVQKGYMAYLNILANKLKDSEDTLIQSYCKRSPVWKKFTDTILSESNQKNSVILMEPQQRNSLTSPALPTSSSLNGLNSFHDLIEDKLEGISETVNFPSKMPGLGFGLFKSKQNMNSNNNNNTYKVNIIGVGQGDDIVSPTYNGDFVETEIKERKDCEIRCPQSVDVKFGLQAGLPKSEIFDMVMDSPIARTVSPKMESMKIQAKDIEDEREEIIYS